MKVKETLFRVTMDFSIMRISIILCTLLSLISNGDCKCVVKGSETMVVECTDTFPVTESEIPSGNVQHLDVHDVMSLPPIRLMPSHFANYSNLKEVKSIKIHQTTLVAVEKYAFHDMSYLSTLEITDNHMLKTIHPEVISQVGDLRILSLSGNIKLFNQISGPILISETLEELDLSRCEIDHLPQDAFDHLKQLSYINLSHNKLSKIPSATFSGLSGLVELDLSMNLLLQLPWYMLHNSTLIQTLNLCGNPISDIHEDIFPDSMNAELTLNLMETELTAINIPPLASLTNLNLGGSLVSSIEKLSSLPELTYLNLSYTKISKVDQTSFKENPKLEVILLSGNPSLILPPQFDGSFYNLYHMDISNCGLVQLMPNLFKQMTYISRVNLSRNALSDSESLGRALSPLRILKVLDLSHNNLRVIGEEDFSGNGHLTQLILSGNPLVSPPSLASTTNLFHLDLSRCTLTRLHLPDIFQQGQRLNSLSLASNNLSSLIDEDHLDEIPSWKFPPSMKLLDLSGNPWACDPSFLLLIDEAVSRGISPSSEPQQHTEPLGDASRDIDQEWKWLRDKVCEQPHFDVEITLKPLNLPPALEGIVTAKFPFLLTLGILAAVILGSAILLLILYIRYNKHLQQARRFLPPQKSLNVSLVGTASGLKISGRGKDYQRLQEDRSPSSPTTPRIYRPPQKEHHFTYPDIPERDSENCDNVKE